jgi:perosamine synthetase
MTTGEGGMLVTDRTDYYQRCAFLRDHGRTPEGFKYFVSQELAYKYKMSSLQAAFGLAQLERLEELVGRKRDIFSWYEKRLRDVPGIQLNSEPPGTRNTYWMVTIIADPSYGITNREMMDYLDQKGIDSRPFFPPLSSLPAFAAMPDIERARKNNTIAYRIAPLGLNLPSALLLDEEQVDYVCSAVRDMFRQKRHTEVIVR